MKCIVATVYKYLLPSKSLNFNLYINGNKIFAQNLVVYCAKIQTVNKIRTTVPSYITKRKIQTSKVPTDGKGRGWRPERPIILILYQKVPIVLIRYLKRNSSQPQKTTTQKFESIKCIGRSGL